MLASCAQVNASVMPQDGSADIKCAVVASIPAALWSCALTEPFPLQMPGFCRYVEPVVIAPIHVLHGRGSELGGRQVVEAGKGDRHVVTADLLDVALRVDAHSAVAAKHVVI